MTLQTVKLIKLQAENQILIDKSNKLKKVKGEKRSLKAEVDQLKTKKAVNDNNSTKLILLEKQNQSLESQLKDEKNINSNVYKELAKFKILLDQEKEQTGNLMSMVRENQLDNEGDSSDLSLLSRPKVLFIIDQNRDVIMKYINRHDIDATVYSFSDSIEGC